MGPCNLCAGRLQVETYLRDEMSRCGCCDGSHAQLKFVDGESARRANAVYVVDSVNFIVSLVERLLQKSDEFCRVDPPAVNILKVVDVVVGRRVGTAGVGRFERRTLTVARHC